MNDQIVLAHGGGGRLARALIEREIVSRFGKEALQGLPDAARLSLPGNSLLFSTDSFVVEPIFFPGGNIGDLAVYGTVNDLVVAGGRPLFLSLSLIIEEGFDLISFCQVLDTIKSAAQRCNVKIVTGDTKVVRRGQADKIYINSAGIAEPLPNFKLGVEQIVAGDCVLVSGPLGDHGMAVMAVRNGFHFSDVLTSDTGPLDRLVYALDNLADQVRVMRDPTRGGLAAVLNELVNDCPFGVELDEVAIPFGAGSRAAAELLGIDLLHVACEGRLLAICSKEAAPLILERWRTLEEGRAAAIIGRISPKNKEVILNTVAAGQRFVDWPAGELLPRIC